MLCFGLKRRREDKQKLKVEEKKQGGSEWGKGEKFHEYHPCVEHMDEQFYSYCVL